MKKCQVVNKNTKKDGITQAVHAPDDPDALTTTSGTSLASLPSAAIMYAPVGLSTKLRSHPVPFPVFSRRHSDDPSELPAEIRGIRESGAQRNFADRKTCRYKQILRRLYPP